MTLLYFLRAMLLSVEALVIAIALLLWSQFHGSIQNLAAALTFNEEILKYLMVVPLGLAIWVINELRLLLQEDKETVRILIAWPEYWKLKLHVWVSLLYAAVFTCVSIAPWFVKGGITTGFGLLLFATSIAGQFSLAISVYAARFRIKEILANAPDR